MRWPACVVSFVDTDGIRHAVDVEAESLFVGGGSGLAHLQATQLRTGIDYKTRSGSTQRGDSHCYTEATASVAARRREESEGSGDEGTI